MIDYVQITSISIDMSTEEAPYNRIYAKPIEKQGDVLLCEFESANYDIEQKDLKEQNAQLKELLEWCRDELFEIYSNEVSHPEDVPIIKKLAEALK